VPEPLARFLRVTSSGNVYGPYKQQGATEPIYRWRLQKLDDVRRLLHVLQPWLSSVKRRQAWAALATVDRQAALSRGRLDWGSHKTHCTHGHEYALGRMRPYVSRGGIQRRDSKQCLVCAREQARARRRAGDVTC
jgi:hypothetical protein